jgi:hypothetical protein
MSKYETSSASNELVGSTVDIKYQEKVEMMKMMGLEWRANIRRKWR